jgi:hypothetical protein
MKATDVRFRAFETHFSDWRNETTRNSETEFLGWPPQRPISRHDLPALQFRISTPNVADWQTCRGASDRCALIDACELAAFLMIIDLARRAPVCVEFLAAAGSAIAGPTFYAPCPLSAVGWSGMMPEPKSGRV